MTFTKPWISFPQDTETKVPVLDVYFRTTEGQETRELFVVDSGAGVGLGHAAYLCEALGLRWAEAGTEVELRGIVPREECRIVARLHPVEIYVRRCQPSAHDTDLLRGLGRRTAPAWPRRVFRRLWHLFRQEESADSLRVVRTATDALFNLQWAYRHTQPPTSPSIGNASQLAPPLPWTNREAVLRQTQKSGAARELQRTRSVNPPLQEGRGDDSRQAVSTRRKGE